MAKVIECSQVVPDSGCDRNRGRGSAECCGACQVARDRRGHSRSHGEGKGSDARRVDGAPNCRDGRVEGGPSTDRLRALIAIAEPAVG